VVDMHLIPPTQPPAFESVSYMLCTSTALVPKQHRALPQGNWHPPRKGHHVKNSENFR
jgi:hypothetical protein